MRMLIAGLFLLVLIQPASAGTLLTMEDAERLFLENSLELKAKTAELRKSDADVVGARLLPNPEARYFNATEGSGPRNHEVTYSVVQPIDITGRRGKRIETAERRREAQRFSFDYDKLAMLSFMKQSYYRILLFDDI